MHRCGSATSSWPMARRSASAGAATKRWTEATRRREEIGKTMARLKDKYQQDVVPAMMKEFNYKNPMQVPRLQKITLNIGVGEATQNAKAIDSVVTELTAIAG